MIRFIAVLMLLALFCSPAFAREFPHFYQGVRPLGMGGAFTAVADDENALFYNPAGLAVVQKRRIALFNPLVVSSEGNFDLYKDIKDTDFDTTSEVADLIRRNMGDTAHFRTALFPHLVTTNFGIGVLGQIQANLEARNVAFPEVDAAALGTVSGHIGVAHTFFDEILRVGGTLKYVTASRLNEIYTAADIADPNFEDRIDDDMRRGGGFGLDLGVMATAPVVLKPTVAVAVLNVGDVNLGDAGKLPQQINIGTSISHDVLPWMRLIGAADWLDVTNNVGEDKDFFKRTHFGLEAKMPYVSLRAGLYQGYGSFGAGLDLRYLRLEYANYAAEVGAFAGGQADRRHVAQISLGW